MKQKKLICAMLAALLLALSACGASASDSAAAEPAAAEPAIEAMDNGAYTEEAALYDGEYAEEMAVEAAAGTDTTADTDRSGMIQSEGTADLADKIIYTASAELETTDLDKSVDTLYKLVDQYGAFLESSSVTGNNLLDIAAGYTYGRMANFTLRVPKEHYSDLTSALDTVGNVTYLTSNAENITAQYSDVEAQVKSYDTQEQRLLEIMAQADTVEDMITLESRLSEVRMEKERLETQLQNWDRQVDYSTVSVSLTEVQELTPEPPEEEPTYMEQLGQTFMDSVHWMGRAAKGGFRLLVAVIPVLLPIAVVILAVVLICKCAAKRKLKKQEEILRKQNVEDDKD